ncbi:MAG: serine hydrolase domain-containing protein [Candidatus Hodarchaeales archaeon]
MISKTHQGLLQEKPTETLKIFPPVEGTPSTACRNPKKHHLINLRSSSLASLVLLLVIIVLILAGTNPLPTNIHLSSEESTVTEEQGINSNKLDEMYARIIKYDIGIDSIIIARNGHLVYEKYFEYYNYSNLHQMQSITKSITSILIGIANATGFITNLDQPILDIFTSRSFVNVDARKQTITIRHLLKMQTGMECDEGAFLPFISTIDKHDYELLSNLSADRFENIPLSPNRNLMRMVNSDDWVQYVLDKPMVAAPGTVYKYDSGASHLLSAIIRNKTGMNAVDFAKKHLFDPLNITDYHWWNDSMGISTGAFGLWLQPIDMVKIGNLYLNNGTWKGSQIVPMEWVWESTIPFTTATPNGPLGYQWWINPSKTYYYAFGLGGQFIVIKPDEKMVVTITASEYTDMVFQPRKILHDFIL